MRISLDLHVHSAASHDGRMSLDDIVSAAKAAGLQGVAVTDHDAAPPNPPLLGDFLMIPGCEFSTEYGHLLGLFLCRPVEKQPFPALVEAIHAQGGLAVLAHPFEHSRDPARIEAIVPLLDGAEVWNGRAERKIRDANALARQFAQTHGLRPFAGSDAHLKEEIGNGVMTLEVPELTLEAVKNALLTVPAEIRGRRGSSLCVARSQFTRLQKRRAAPAAYAKWLLFAGKCAAEDLIRR